MAIVRSARGDLVDMDLLKIKQQMAASPKDLVVVTRENFVDNRFKRQLKQHTETAIKLAQTVEETPQPDVENISVSILDDLSNEVAVDVSNKKSKTKEGI